MPMLKFSLLCNNLSSFLKLLFFKLKKKQGTRPWERTLCPKHWAKFVTTCVPIKQKENKSVEWSFLYYIFFSFVVYQYSWLLTLYIDDILIHDHPCQFVAKTELWVWDDGWFFIVCQCECNVKMDFWFACGWPIKTGHKNVIDSKWWWFVWHIYWMVISQLE